MKYTFHIPTKGFPHPPPLLSLAGPPLPVDLPTVLMTVQQKKSELRKDQSADPLNHWGFTFCSSFSRSRFRPSSTPERQDGVREKVPPSKTGPAQVKGCLLPGPRPLPRGPHQHDMGALGAFCSTSLQFRSCSGSCGDQEPT